MQHLEVSGAVRPLKWPLGVKWLRPRIISTFGTTRVIGRQPYAPAAFTHFQRLSRLQGTEGTTEKIPSDTTGNRSRDRPASSAAP